MRLIFSEFPADYSKYHFPYQVIGIKDHKDNLPQLYDNGWLPYRSKKNWFYLCRSTRIRLSQFALSSENRRILSKTQELTYTVQPVEQFKLTPQIQKLCKKFADHKFGKGMMPTAAIRKMFTDANTTHVLTFHDQSGPVGYVAVTVHEHFLHYAHPFYDLQQKSPDVGMGMLVRTIQWAKDQHKQFAYLGTCYSENALYKTQFSGFEFFNGWHWSTELEELKFIIKRSGNLHLLQDDSYGQEYKSQLNGSGVKVNLR